MEEHYEAWLRLTESVVIPLKQKQMSIYVSPVTPNMSPYISKLRFVNRNSIVKSSNIPIFSF